VKVLIRNFGRLEWIEGRETKIADDGRLIIVQSDTSGIRVPIRCVDAIVTKNKEGEVNFHNTNANRG